MDPEILNSYSKLNHLNVSRETFLDFENYITMILEKNKKINKCNGELSLHVLDIIQSTMKACKTNKPQVIKTTCKKPGLFQTKDIKKILK